ncbi:YceI family protein [Lutibacter sp. B1]|uniref:YceI family protein n=1 Tax=Lutibacter sp. B1 TaxID=2725996 RepID=UPI0014578B01|nr:YceI family protein [Lutibacter sp. B1]NLP59254.1 YceI family protein [Lutibacter sp. B1]
MKNTIKTITFTVIAIVTLSFTAVETEKKEVKIENSKVVWKGYKVTGSHEGTVNLKSGSLTFHNDKLTGGEFIIDMETIVSTDLTGEYKEKLEGHLKSDDFFGVKNNPTAKLKFTDAKSKGKNSYTITGDLTIKGKTNPVTFDISIYGKKATAALKVDRTEYDVKYGSASFFDGLKDKAIYDEFDLVVDLEF